MRVHIQHQTLPAPGLRTLAWADEQTLIDWAGGGQRYGLDGQQSQAGQYHFRAGFDRAITSADGQYAFIYQVLGTKGLLLKNGELLREINRSYYHAHVYEYPAAFATVDGTTYLVHCPAEYCRLDVECVETGEVVTNIAGREPSDCFHSRLEVSPANGYLLSKGWLWHPWDVVAAYDLRACLANPKLLDELPPHPGRDTELCSAGFLTEQRVLLSASGEEAIDDEAAIPPGHLAWWDLKTNEFSPAVAVREPFGNVFPISEYLAWDLLGHPKILDLTTGEVVARLDTLATGRQGSSIMWNIHAPAIVFHRGTQRVAVQNGDYIEVLSVQYEG